MQLAAALELGDARGRELGKNVWSYGENGGFSCC